MFVCCVVMVMVMVIGWWFVEGGLLAWYFDVVIVRSCVVYLCGLCLGLFVYVVNVCV